MRIAVVSIALASLLGGCGEGYSGDAKVVHDTCAANGGAPAYCDCMVKTLQEKLTPEAFAKVAQGDDDGDLMATLDVMGGADKACAAPAG